MDNIEWATLIFIILVLIILTVWKDTRYQFLTLIKSLLKLIIVPAFQVITLYQIIIIIGLIWILLNYNFSLWYIKNYLILLIISIIPFIFKIKNRKSIYKLKSILFESFTVAAFITFIIHQYTFSLMVEIVLVPFIFFILLMETFTESIDKYSQVHKFFKFLDSTILIIIFIHSFFKLIQHSLDIKSYSFWLNYFSDIIFWLVNIPLLIIWIYIIQLDTLIPFLKSKSNAFSILYILICKQVLYLKYRKNIKDIDLSLINNIYLGGIIKKCYYVNLKAESTKKQIQSILVSLQTAHGPIKMYKGTDIVFPLRITITLSDSTSNTIFWEEPNLDDEYKDW